MTGTPLTSKGKSKQVEPKEKSVRKDQPYRLQDEIKKSQGSNAVAAQGLGVSAQMPGRQTRDGVASAQLDIRHLSPERSQYNPVCSNTPAGQYRVSPHWQIPRPEPRVVESVRLPQKIDRGPGAPTPQRSGTPVEDWIDEQRIHWTNPCEQVRPRAQTDLHNQRFVQRPGDGSSAPRRGSSPGPSGMDAHMLGAQRSGTPSHRVSPQHFPIRSLTPGAEMPVASARAPFYRVDGFEERPPMRPRSQSCGYNQRPIHQASASPRKMDIWNKHAAKNFRGEAARELSNQQAKMQAPPYRMMPGIQGIGRNTKIAQFKESLIIQLRYFPDTTEEPVIAAKLIRDKDFPNKKISSEGVHYDKYNGESLIHILARLNAVSMIVSLYHEDKILELNADFNAKNACGQNALHVLLSRLLPDTHYIPTVGVLIKAGVSVRDKDNDRKSVIEYAISSGRGEIIERLCKEITDWKELKALSGKFSHPLIDARIVELGGVMSPSSSPSSTFDDSIPESPLTQQAKARGLKPDVMHKQKLPPLVNAIVNGEYRQAMDVIQKNQIAQDTLDVALHVAVDRSPTNNALINALIDKGARANSVDTQKSTVLCKAIKRNSNEAVAILLEKGANSNDVDPLTGNPVFATAAYNYKQDKNQNSLSIMKLLLARNVDQNAKVNVYAKDTTPDQMSSGKAKVDSVIKVAQLVNECGLSDSNLPVHHLEISPPISLPKQQDIVQFEAIERIGINTEEYLHVQQDPRIPSPQKTQVEPASDDDISLTSVEVSEKEQPGSDDDMSLTSVEVSEKEQPGSSGRHVSINEVVYEIEPRSPVSSSDDGKQAVHSYSPVPPPVFLPTVVNSEYPEIHIPTIVMPKGPDYSPVIHASQPGALPLVQQENKATLAIQQPENDVPQEALPESVPAENAVPLGKVGLALFTVNKIIEQKESTKYFFSHVIPMFPKSWMNVKYANRTFLNREGFSSVVHVLSSLGQTVVLYKALPEVSYITGLPLLNSGLYVAKKYFYDAQAKVFARDLAQGNYTIESPLELLERCGNMMITSGTLSALNSLNPNPANVALSVLNGAANSGLACYNIYNKAGLTKSEPVEQGYMHKLLPYALTLAEVGVFYAANMIPKVEDFKSVSSGLSALNTVATMVSALSFTFQQAENIVYGISTVMPDVENIPVVGKLVGAIQTLWPSESEE